MSLETRLRSLIAALGADYKTLKADKADRIHTHSSDQIVQGRLSPQGLTTTDWNNARDSGWWVSTPGALNTPEGPGAAGSWYQGVVEADVGAWRVQRVSVTGGSDVRWTRAWDPNNSRWTNWRQYTPGPHSHDDRYYTEAEADSRFTRHQSRAAFQANSAQTGAFGGGDALEVRNDIGYPSITFHKAQVMAPQLRALDGQTFEFASQSGTSPIDAKARNFHATQGVFAGGQELVKTNDARLSNARTPTAHGHTANDITSGVLATARLGTGTANSSSWLRGDGVWAAVPVQTLASLGAAPAVHGHALTDANITGILPLAQMPAHSHDDRYYTEAEADGRFVPKINREGLNSLARVTGLINAQFRLPSMSQYLVIHTNFAFDNHMVDLRIHGYNYSPNGVIDLRVQFYARNGTFIYPEVVNNGSMPVSVFLARRLSDGKVAVILQSLGPGNYWEYPKITVDGTFGYTVLSDAQLSGWGLHNDSVLTGYSVLSTPPVKTIYQTADEAAQAVLARHSKTGGPITLPVSAVNTTYSIRIPFGHTFAWTPKVSVQTSNVSAPHTVHFTIGSIDQTGFTLYYRRSSGTGNFNVQWIALL